jgi:hypothetical protein
MDLPGIDPGDFLVGERGPVNGLNDFGLQGRRRT